MALEALKCPQCGANLEVNATVRSFFCTYCGTKLQATVSSQGLVSASILGEIKEDTSILAKRQALAHLKEQLVQLVEQRRIKEINLQPEYVAKREALFRRSFKHTGFFGDPLKSKFYIAGEAALTIEMRHTLLDLDTQINNCTKKIASLSDELDRLASNA